MEACSLLCSFYPNAGWRIRKVVAELMDKPEVVTVDGCKYLGIPVLKAKYKGGQFCNPKPLVLGFVRARQRLYNDTQRYLDQRRLRRLAQFNQAFASSPQSISAYIGNLHATKRNPQTTSNPKPIS